MEFNFQNLLLESDIVVKPLKDHLDFGNWSLLKNGLHLRLLKVLIGAQLLINFVQIFGGLGTHSVIKKLRFFGL
jgi:hypothetical protein